MLQKRCNDIPYDGTFIIKNVCAKKFVRSTKLCQWSVMLELQPEILEGLLSLKIIIISSKLGEGK